MASEITNRDRQPSRSATGVAPHARSGNATISGSRVLHEMEKRTVGVVGFGHLGNSGNDTEINAATTVPKASSHQPLQLWRRTRRSYGNVVPHPYPQH